MATKHIVLRDNHGLYHVDSFFSALHEMSVRTVKGVRLSVLRPSVRPSVRQTRRL